MVVTLKEQAIVRKYTTEWEYLFSFLEIAPNTAISITWNPPSGKTFIYTYSSVGPQLITDKFSFELFWDGIKTFNSSSTGALQNRLFIDEPPLKIIKNELILKIVNSDTITHTVDFLLAGYNIQNSSLDAFLKEIMGNENEQLDVLKDIKKLLELSLKVGTFK